MSPQEVQQVYVAHESGGIWPTVLQSIVVSLTSVLTVSVLLGALVAFFVMNSKMILDMVLDKILAVLGTQLAEDVSSDDSDLMFDLDKALQSGQDNLFGGFGCPEMNVQDNGELRNQVNGELVDTSKFTPHENSILELLVEPSKIGVSWDDIAGSEELISSIKEQVIFPIMYSFEHNPDALLMPPKGVLLHGPPGCGKTLMAKALSSEIKAHFINFDISAIKNKWVGETEKLASALFAVARKLQPCIIFIDEVDAFLSQRGDDDQATEQSLKAIFLQQWDGLTTEARNHVVVLAASNRLDSIDEAIQRRLPLQFNVPMPEEEQRAKILDIILRDCDVDGDVDLKNIAEKTDGFSGSDLQEVCRHAATYRLVEFYKQTRNNKLKLPCLPELIGNIEKYKNRLVDPQQIFEQFEHLSQADLVNEDSAQEQESTSLDSDDSWETIAQISRCSGCSGSYSSFKHQNLPSDIVLSLLKDQLAADDADKQLDSQEHSTGPKLFEPVRVRHGDDFFENEGETKDQVICSNQKPMHELKIRTNGKISENSDEPVMPKGLPSGSEQHTLRPISMADLLRALQYSRKTGQEEDIPMGMYN